ncbi:MAG: hypothetical protein M3Z75_06520 [Actinomycetota bacterium]|nr:hypothetical protein [Actinomycetota bacterium]
MRARRIITAVILTLGLAAAGSVTAGAAHASVSPETHLHATAPQTHLHA